MSEEPLHAIAEASFVVFGHPVRVYVLNNGQRVIDAADFEALFTALGEESLSSAGCGVEWGALVNWLNMEGMG